MAPWPYLFVESPLSGIELFQPDLEYLPKSHEGPMPIGKVMEHRFKASLLASERFDVVAHGMQVQDGKRTVGELDFLVHDRQTQDVWHVEFAFKFYLYRQALGRGPLKPWIGPGMRDRLVYKLDKMARKQFPMLYSPHTTPLLVELGLDPKTIKQGLAFGAELFVPPGKDRELIEPPLDNDCFAGHWYFEGSEPQGVAQVLDKPQWISPSQFTGGTTEDHALRERLSNKGYAMCQRENTARWFVVDRGGLRSFD